MYVAASWKLAGPWQWNWWLTSHLEDSGAGSEEHGQGTLGRTVGREIWSPAVWAVTWVKHAWSTHTILFVVFACWLYISFVVLHAYAYFSTLLWLHIDIHRLLAIDYDVVEANATATSWTISEFFLEQCKTHRSEWQGIGTVSLSVGGLTTTILYVHLTTCVNTSVQSAHLSCWQM